MEQLIRIHAVQASHVETVLPGSKVALTIATFSSTDHHRRRSGPVNTSSTPCLVLVKNTAVCLPVIVSG